MLRRFFYRTFRVTWSVQQWIHRRFTAAGRLALAGLVASAVVGLNTNLTMAYQAFTFLVWVLLISMACSRFFTAHVALQRILPRFGTAGEPIAYRVAIRNQTTKRQDGLLLLEHLGDPRPPLDEFLRIPEPGEERRNWFDRAIGYPRWSWLVSRNQGAVGPERPIPTLRPRGAVEVRVEVTPLRRGALTFTATTVARPDPLGLFKAFVTVPAGQSVLVLPRRYPLPRVQLPGTRKYQQGGVALASSVGDSEEFVSLREYRPGDPRRRIHWKSWARVGRPIVKEYQEEFFARHALILDTFLDTEDSEIFEESVSVAASFACALETQESLLDLMFVGPEAYCFTAGRGVAPTERMLEILAGVRPCRDKPVQALHHLVLEHSSALSGCVVILLAWDDDRRRLVGHLKSLGVPALVLVVTDARSPAAATSAVDPTPEDVRRLEVGRIAEGLAAL